MWAQILNTALGLWLMAAPGIFHYDGKAADNDHIIGPVITTFAIVALSGCTRNVAKFNIPLGVWLLLAPWVLGYEETIPIYSDLGAGLLVTVCSFIVRKTPDEYGGGWPAFLRSDTLHAREAKRQSSKA